MAGKTGQSADTVIGKLLKSANRYSFVQVMRLMRHAGCLPEMDDIPPGALPAAGSVRIRPANNLAFPASDVLGMNELTGDDPVYQIEAAFLGLYGPASPLPTFYTEDLLQEEAADANAGRDFLDIFNHRLFSLFFHCSMKYRLFFQVCEQNSPAALDKLFSLIGLYEPAQRDAVPDAYALLRYVGILSQYPRSAWGLETILADMFSGSPIKVIPCVSRNISISASQQVRLGRQNSTLGVDTVIGSQVEDRSGKFRLSVGPVSLTQFYELLPGGEKHSGMACVTGLYLQDPLDFDMELTLRAGEAPAARAGGARPARLGLDSWVFSGEGLGEVSVIFPMQ
jgi:type VI secretion system protein ImpH